MIKVLHIDTEKTWRGGENQMRLLMEGSAQQVQSYLACPPDSIAAKKLDEIARVVPTKFTPLRALSEARRLAKLCRAEGIELMDCQTSKAHGFALLIKGFYPKLSLVVHRRVDFSPSKNLFSRRKYFSTKVDAFVAISQAITQILIDYGLPQEKIFTIRSAVDPSPFLGEDPVKCRADIASQLGFSADIPLIVNVAYHTPQKGMETLLEGLAYLREQNENFRCLLAGSGQLTDGLKQKVNELHLENEVIFLGIRKDIPKLLAAADIFALPSNFEGLGTSILDALHSRCAVAATQVGGIPEMIIHEKTGLLSPVGDGRAHGANLLKLVQDRDLRLRLASAGAQKAGEDFSIESMVRGNVKLYQEILEKKKS